MKKTTISDHAFRMWDRLPSIIKAVITGSLVSTAGISVWGAMLSRSLSPWVIPAMILVLWAFWKFFSGRWLSIGARIRSEYFRSTNLCPEGWKWGIAAAILFVVIVQASFVVTFRLIEFPIAKFTADYKLLDTIPIGSAWLIMIMSSIVAGICEEAGFRGYMQVPLEKKYGPAIAIIVTSIVFTMIHLGHTWAYPILPHIFFASILLGILAWRSGSLIPGIIGHSILDVFDYSIWWTDLTGGFTKQTIFKTGIDLHFIVWVMIFSLAVFGFFRIMRRSNGDKKIKHLQLHGTELCNV